MTRHLPMAALALLMASSCNYRKLKDPEPPVPVPEEYSYGGETPTAPTPVPATERWWREFGDPQLSALIDEALVDSPTVRSGFARMRQARWLAVQAGAARYPQINVGGDFFAGTSLTPVIGKVTQLSAIASAPVSYEVDFFARRAREHQAGKLEARASELDQETLIISISAEVAEAWYDLINARENRNLLKEQVETNNRFLGLVELRYREGLTSAVDVHQQRQLVSRAQARLSVAHGQEDLAAQRLAVLLGKSPERTFDIDEVSYPDLGDTPNASVPATLVQQRPDIRAAQKRVEATDRSVAAAIGARLPQVTISASPDYTWLRSKSSGGAFSDEGGPGETPDTTTHGFTWDARASLSVPLFDGRLGVGRIREQEALLDQVVEAYSQALLNALLEVESSLVQERQQRLNIFHLKEQVRLANATLESTRDRYRAGLSDFLPVLTALSTQQDAQLLLLEARRLLVSARIQLHRALGGSWPAEMKEPQE